MARKMNVADALKYYLENKNASHQEVKVILADFLVEAIAYIQANVPVYKPDDISMEVITVEYELDMRKLGKTVLVVAKANIYNGKPQDWSAYIGNIEKDREKEWKQVYDHGSKIGYNLAKFLFPDFAKRYRWRG